MVHCCLKWSIMVLCGLKLSNIVHMLTIELSNWVQHNQVSWSIYLIWCTPLLHQKELRSKNVVVKLVHEGCNINVASPSSFKYSINWLSLGTKNISFFCDHIQFIIGNLMCLAS